MEYTVACTILQETIEEFLCLFIKLNKITVTNRDKLLLCCTNASLYVTLLFFVLPTYDEITFSRCWHDPFVKYRSKIKGFCEELPVRLRSSRAV